MNISPADRQAAASAAGLNEQYVHQCLTGRRAMKPKQAVRLELVSGGRIRRWHVRAADWHEVWPELIGAEGAPPVHASAAREEQRDAA